MEQAQNMMLMKKKHILNSHFQAPINLFNDSWEEQAFAEDAAGALGGCIWPPRSYSCSFCRREFRSAQALGGHMNIHRRDRARLKHSLSPHNEVDLHCQNHNQNPFASLVSHHHTSQVCALDCNSDSNPRPGFVSSSLSPCRVSSLSIQDLSPPYSSVLQQHQTASSYSPPPTWSDSVATTTLLSVSDSKAELLKNQTKEESICLDDDSSVETDLSVGLNTVIRRNRSTGCRDDDATASCKRPKNAAFLSLPLFLKPCSQEGHPLQPEVLGLKPSTMEDIDLELRLGDMPKVK